MNTPQLPLICTPPNPRPKKLTPEMATRAALQIATELAGLDEFAGETPESLAADIIHVARGRHYIDGYELACDLDRYRNWSPDASMVELLDNFSFYASNELDGAVKQWAAENPMTPEFAEGARVRTTHGPGTVQSINPYTPHSYLVKLDDETIRGSLVVRFEDAVAE